MNNLIKNIAEQGQAENFRTGCIAIAAIIAVVFSLWYGKKLGMKTKEIVLFLLIAYPIDYMLQEMGYIGTRFAADNNIFGINSIVNSQAKTFIIIPLVALLAARIIKLPWNITADLLALANLLNYAICSLGCIFTGCCVGYTCSWGIYSLNTGERTFPIQIVNAAIMLLIVFSLLYRSKKLNYVSDGKQFPLKLILFGSTRFFTEFFMNNEKLLFGCSIVALHSILMVVVGTVALIVIENRRKKQQPT